MTSLQFLWRDAGSAAEFRTGVCLHGHTMHSEECLNFLPRYLRYLPGVSQWLAHRQRGPRAIDFARAWWTPPLAPACALRLERNQIAKLGLRPIVSLTDHDNIEAGLSLQADGSVPVSVEWTVPYHRSILHLGIHNLPLAAARQWTGAMARYTAAPDERLLPDILSECDRIAGTLIVLNHPYWLEEGIDGADHRRALGIVLKQCNRWFHAFELNGTRTWNENREVVKLAREWSRPLISGGDRHAGEASACINLTNAECFAAFAAEIRAGYSSVLFLPHYRRPMPLRIAAAIRDILRPYPEYPGREHWTDRIFYRGEDGIARALSAVWGGTLPWGMGPIMGSLQKLHPARSTR